MPICKISWIKLNYLKISWKNARAHTHTHTQTLITLGIGLYIFIYIQHRFRNLVSFCWHITVFTEIILKQLLQCTLKIFFPGPVIVSSCMFINQTALHIKKCMWNITPYKRFKMKLQSNLNCHICNTTSSGTFLHMFWECSVVISLWTHVNLVLSSLLRIDWSVNPSSCLLNDDSDLCISSMQKRMLFAGFTAVKKTIIQNWFTPHV